jgi:hypothetical protein
MVDMTAIQPPKSRVFYVRFPPRLCKNPNMAKLDAIICFRRAKIFVSVIAGSAKEG